MIRKSSDLLLGWTLFILRLDSNRSLLLKMLWFNESNYTDLQSGSWHWTSWSLSNAWNRIRWLAIVKLIAHPFSWQLSTIHSLSKLYRFCYTLHTLHTLHTKFAWKLIEICLHRLLSPDAPRYFEFSKFKIWIENRRSEASWNQFSIVVAKASSKIFSEEFENWFQKENLWEVQFN